MVGIVALMVVSDSSIVVSLWFFSGFLDDFYWF